MNIFISYSSKDREHVRVLAEDFALLGYNVWFDQALTGGRDWWDDILERIRTCDLFVFALSPNSLDSRPCQLERDYASDLNKRVLPVQMGEVNFKTLPVALTRLHTVDVRGADARANLRHLRGALENLPPARPLPNPLPDEPEVPISPLNELAERVANPPTGVRDQLHLILDIREAMDEDKAGAIELLRKLLAFDGLTPKAIQDINALLSNPTPTQAPAITKPAPIAPTTVPTYYPTLKPHTLTHIYDVTSAVFSPNGRYILTNGGKGGRFSNFKIPQLWRAVSGEKIRTFKGHKSNVTCLAFSPDSRTMLTGSEDTTTRLWDVQTGQHIRSFIGHTGTVYSVAFSPDGRTIATGSIDTTARLWDVKTGQHIRTFTGHDKLVTSVAFSSDGYTILTGSSDTTARLWDIQTGQKIRALTGHIKRVNSVAFSPDAHTILTGSDDNTARLWNIQNGDTVHIFQRHSKGVNSVAFSPDGRFILTGSSDMTACLWNIQTGEVIHVFQSHEDWVSSVAFSSDSLFILTGSLDSTVHIWSLEGII